MKIRENVQRFEVYNSGLFVFLYDEANKEKIIKEKPSIIDSESIRPFSDNRLKELAEKGLLVVYELRQDDSLCVDIVVGEPLCSLEKKKIPIKSLQKALISLPSGKLFIDSYDSLRLSVDNQPEEEGAVFNVPSGSYLLTLHRVNRDKLQNKNLKADKIPSEIITLTPISEKDASFTAASVLRYKMEGPSWLGKYKIKDNVFSGKVIKDTFSGEISVNLDEKAAGKLNLNNKTALQLETGGKTFKAVFLGDVDLFSPWYFGVYNSKEFVQLKKNYDCSAIWMSLIYPKWLKVLVFMPFEIREKIIRQEGFIKVNQLAKITVLTEKQDFEVDVNWKDDWRIADQKLTACVLGCNAGNIIFNAGVAALEQLGVRKSFTAEPGRGIKLSLEANNKKYKLVYFINKDNFQAEAKRRLNENNIIGGLLVPHWFNPEQKVLSCRSLGQDINFNLEHLATGSYVQITLD